MPIEIDIGNLKKRVEDAMSDLPNKIAEKEAELESLQELRAKGNDLIGRADELMDDINEFLVETQEID